MTATTTGKKAGGGLGGVGGCWGQGCSKNTRQQTTELFRDFGGSRLLRVLLLYGTDCERPCWPAAPGELSAVLACAPCRTFTARETPSNPSSSSSQNTRASEGRARRLDRAIFVIGGRGHGGRRQRRRRSGGRGRVRRGHGGELGLGRTQLRRLQLVRSANSRCSGGGWQPCFLEKQRGPPSASEAGLSDREASVKEVRRSFPFGEFVTSSFLEGRSACQRTLRHAHRKQSARSCGQEQRPWHFVSRARKKKKTVGRRVVWQPFSHSLIKTDVHLLKQKAWQTHAHAPVVNSSRTSNIISPPVFRAEAKQADVAWAETKKAKPPPFSHGEKQLHRRGENERSHLTR